MMTTTDKPSDRNLLIFSDSRKNICKDAFILTYILFDF